MVRKSELSSEFMVNKCLIVKCCFGELKRIRYLESVEVLEEKDYYGSFQSNRKCGRNCEGKFLEGTLLDRDNKIGQKHHYV